MSKEDGLVCVICGDPWQRAANICPTCGSFCTWGNEKGGTPSSWREDGSPELVPTGGPLGEGETECFNCQFHFYYPDASKDSGLMKWGTTTCPLCGSDNQGQTNPLSDPPGLNPLNSAKKKSDEKLKEAIAQIERGLTRIEKALRLK